MTEEIKIDKRKERKKERTKKERKRESMRMDMYKKIRVPCFCLENNILKAHQKGGETVPLCMSLLVCSKCVTIYKFMFVF